MTGRSIDVTTDPWVVRFPYTSALNAMLSATPGAAWHTRAGEWRVCPSDAAAALLMLLERDHGFGVTGSLAAAAHLDLADLSRALDHDLVVDGLRGDLFPFQRAAVAYVAETRRTFVADEMGVGKTITALGSLQYLDAWPAVVMVPRKLRSNWAVEATRWLPASARIAVVVAPSTTASEVDRLAARGVSVQHRPRRGCQLYVVSYSTVARHVADLIDLRPAGLVLDESQLCKTRDRTVVCAACGADLRRGVCGGPGRHRARDVGQTSVYKVRATRSAKAVADAIPADGVVLALSGTPNKNTTADFIAQLDILGRLDDFGGEAMFLDRYCGVDGRGGSNLPELNQRLRTRCFVRRRKADVMPGLPAILRPQLLVDLEPAERADYDWAAGDVATHIAALAAEIADRDGLDPGTAAFEARLRAEAGLFLVRIGTLLKLAALAKVPAAVDWARDFLASTDRKLVIFAHHREVIAGLVDALGCDRIDGTTTDSTPIVDRFQTDPSCRVLVLGVTAGGVGLTLTAASDMLFVETAWTPADLDQAESRCYGRVNDAHGATATYLSAADTLDEARWALIERKRARNELAADGTVEADRRAAEVEFAADFIARIL